MQSRDGMVIVCSCLYCGKIIKKYISSDDLKKFFSIKKMDYDSIFLYPELNYVEYFNSLMVCDSSTCKEKAEKNNRIDNNDLNNSRSFLKIKITMTSKNISDKSEEESLNTKSKECDIPDDWEMVIEYPDIWNEIKNKYPDMILYEKLRKYNKRAIERKNLNRKNENKK